MFCSVLPQSPPLGSFSAPNKALRLIAQAFRENQAIFAMGAFDVGSTLVWAGAPNKAVRLIMRELRGFLFRGAPNEAFCLMVQELRENQGIFVMGGFDALLVQVWAGASDEAFRLIVQELRDNQGIFAMGGFDALLLPA